MDRRGERGAVLIVAMGIMLLIAVFAMEAAYTTEVEGLASDRLSHRLQAVLLARGGVHAAGEILRRDDASIDTLDDDWSEEYLLEEAGGTIRISIHDESGKFPLQRIYTTRLDLEFEAAFLRLLDELELPEEISDCAVDWIDPDDEPFPHGAEDPWYSGLNPPRGTPDRPFVSTRELGLLAAVPDTEAAETLRTFVTVHGSGSVNINTAPVEVLLALNPIIERSTAERIVDFRERYPFSELSDLENAGLDEAEIAEFERKGAGVTSDCFSVDVEADYASAVARIEAVLERGTSGTSVLYWREY